eukprot:TRINITY_DN17441_c0_g1_i1.p1 TRINITY_DN17441_c0_g1~~TRINITY_DN17441_c0_g1_i1.p1  ORF type:complete len:194 (+),score=40.44 TRINITY_DN17441_c0_g1_i1:38-619(+)
MQHGHKYAATLEKLESISAPKSSSRAFSSSSKGIEDLVSDIAPVPLPPTKNTKRRVAKKKTKENSSLKNWYGMEKPTMTPELERDITIIHNRPYIFKNRHYAKPDSDKLPQHFEMGTVIEGPTDWYSGRLTKKERSQSITESFMKDPEFMNYAERKYEQITKRNKTQKAKSKAKVFHKGKLVPQNPIQKYKRH